MPTMGEGVGLLVVSFFTTLNGSELFDPLISISRSVVSFM